MTQVHLHISAAFTGTVTVTDPDGGITTVKGTAHVADEATGLGITNSAHTVEPAGLPADVEQMVVRHEKNGAPGTRSREMTQTLIERGWTPKVGPKYLRFIYTGSRGKVTLYANSRDLITRENQLWAKKLPGAVMTASGVRWRYTGEDFDTALAAADAVMARAHFDGLEDSAEN